MVAWSRPRGQRILVQSGVARTTLIRDKTFVFEAFWNDTLRPKTCHATPPNGVDNNHERSWKTSNIPGTIGNLISQFRCPND